MLMGLLKPEWEAAAKQGPREWERAYKEWEQAIAAYEAQSGEMVGHATRIAVVTRWAPPDVQSTIRASLSVIGNDYAKLQRVVLEYIASGRVFENTGAPLGVIPTPMDVGVLSGASSATAWESVSSGDVFGIHKGGKADGKGKTKKGAGKGKNADKICRNCGKKGHVQAECWAEGGGAHKGTPKAKAKPQAKAKGKVCNYCHKPNHTEAECRKKKKDEANGSVRAIAEVDEEGDEDQVKWIMGIHDEIGNQCECATSSAALWAGGLSAVQ